MTTDTTVQPIAVGSNPGATLIAPARATGRPIDCDTVAQIADSVDLFIRGVKAGRLTKAGDGDA